MNFSKRLIIYVSATICLLYIYRSSPAQTNQGVGNWNSLLLKASLSQKWSSISEAHIRSSSYSLKYDYFEIKTGISYSFTKNFSALVGTGFYNTDEPGGFFQTPALQKEFRTWFELNLKQAIKRLKIEHRGRLEQRFLPNNYKNRLKYRLALFLPLNKAAIVPGSLYLAVNDELFMPQHGPVVEKNRIYLGSGYKLNRNVALQLGCVSDTDYKSDGHSVKNYLQMMLIYDYTNLIRKHS